MVSSCRFTHLMPQNATFTTFRTPIGDKIPKENKHYTCIACITIDFVMRMEKKNYPQLYLEECKHRMKKRKMTTIIEAKLESGSESKSDIKLELKSELESDIE